jgi:hypothetical protein
MREEHIFGCILYVSNDDNYGQPQRLTTLYCLVLGTIAVDAVFSAGSAGEGEQTMMTKIVSAMMVSFIMFPCNMLFTFLFTKSKPPPIPIINYKLLKIKLQRNKRFKALLPQGVHGKKSAQDQARIQQSNGAFVPLN